MRATTGWSSHRTRWESAKSEADFVPASKTLAEGSTELSRAVAERVKHEVHSRFQSAFDNAPIGMALIDRDGRWLEVNDALSQITGYSRDELKATTLLAITHPDDVAIDTQTERDLLSGQVPSYQVEKRCRHARGHYLWVLVTVSLARDDRGQPHYVISQVQDISERKKVAERLEYLVDHDFLTGLFNRRRFEQELSKEARRAARYGVSGALVLIDLDRFKDVNDVLGHEAGDDLLKGVASALRDRIRQTDVLARVGGDEFAVLLPQTGARQAQIVTAGIVKCLRRHAVVVGGRSISVTASMGVALFDGLTAAELMARADLAMYEAKAAGRDRFVTYRWAPDREPLGSSRKRRELPPALKRRPLTEFP